MTEKDFETNKLQLNKLHLGKSYIRKTYFHYTIILRRTSCQVPVFCKKNSYEMTSELPAGLSCNIFSIFGKIHKCN